MKLDTILSRDSSLELAFPGAWDRDILGVTTQENLKQDHVIFVKNSKFFSRFLENYEKSPEANKAHFHLVIIIDKKYFNELKIPPFLKTEQFLVLTTTHFDKSMVELSQLLYEMKWKIDENFLDGRQLGTAEVHSEAFVAQGVFIGNHVSIGPGAKIYPQAVIMSHTKIGANTTIFPNVTVYPFTEIGQNCRIHASSVIGGDGFGYKFYEGKHHKLWHTGGVIIEDNVEIGANSAVDGGTFSPTIIGRGSKIDNFVQVGHNSIIGKNVILCGHVALGGSVKVGDYCVFGGKAGMGPDLVLGNNCQIAGGALVNCDWPENSKLGGHPARPVNEWLKGLAYVRNQTVNKPQS